LLVVDLFERCLDSAEQQEELLGQAPTAIAQKVRDLLPKAAVPEQRTQKRIELLADRYIIGEKLGEGGFGEVYRAVRRDNNETVVVKFPQRPLSDRPAFLEEQRHLATLTDDRIARFLDCCEVAGYPFLVMEFVDGVHLDKYCARKSVKQIVEVFLHVVDAIAYAHQRLLMHRDIKPSNIMVRVDGQVKVLDFGLARAIDAKARETTTSYSRAHSLPYSPPEQIESGDMTLSSDVFALCAVLYELLADVKVREVPRPEARRSQERAYLALVRQELPPASKRALKPDRRSAIRGELDMILQKGLQSQGERRYGDAHELASDLRKYLAHEPITANPRFGGF